MKAFFRDFGIVLLLGAALVLCGFLTACVTDKPAERAGVSQASLVTLMRKVAASPEPVWGANGWRMFQRQAKNGGTVDLTCSGLARITFRVHAR